MQQKRPAFVFTPIIICGLAALFYVYDYFIQVAPSVMSQALMHDFSTSAAGLGILSACFYYSYTLMQIPAGLLLDRFGARKLLTLAVMVDACGVTLFGTAHHLMVAGLGRFLIGLGSSFAFICAIFLVARWFAHRYFALIVGLVQLAGCLGSIVGLAPLAVLINHIGWRHTMVITAVITFILSIIYWLVIRDGRASQQYVAYDIKNEWQRLYYLCRKPQVWWIALCGLVCWVPVATVGALWGVPYLMKAYGWSNTLAGQYGILFWLGLGIGSPFIGWFSDRIQNRCQPAVICFVLGLIGAVILLRAPNVAPWLIAVALLLLGFSSSVQALTFSMLRDVLPDNVFGTACGVNNMAAIIGGAISQPLVGILMDWHREIAATHHVFAYTVSDYHVALLMLPLAILIGLWVVLSKIKKTPNRLIKPN